MFEGRKVGEEFPADGMVFSENSVLFPNKIRRFDECDEIKFHEGCEKNLHQIEKFAPKSFDLEEKPPTKEKKRVLLGELTRFFETSIAESILMVNLEELISKTYKEL